MTRRFIEIVFIVILAGCFSTCRKDETDEMLPPIDRQKEVAAAKQWYESRFGNLMLKSAVAEENGSGKTVLKPEWRTARVHHNRRLKTVETDLMPTDSALFFVSPENKQKFEETGDDRYLSSLTRLVVQTHRRSGRQIGFLMTIIPSVSYLERTDFDPFKKMAYVGRDKKFSGSILFRHTDGTFSNGWMYSEGKITGSIRDNDRDNEPVISLKGYEICTTHYIAEFWNRCTYTLCCEHEDGTWELTHINCSGWEYAGSYTYTICTYHETYEDEFDEGDETGESGGGGGGGYTGPPQPTHYSVSVTANPSSGGTVSGGGTFQSGSEATIYATAYPGYTFVDWTGSSAVSATSHTFTVTGSVSFTANFIKNDCVELSATANDPVISGYMDNLIQGRMANDPNSEHGDLIRANGTYLQKTSGSSATYSFEPGVQYTHSFHSHTSGNWNMIFASHSDLFALWKTYNGGHMYHAADFVFGIVGSESSMIIQIEDPTLFQNYITGLGTTEAAQQLQLKTYFDAALGIGTPQGFDTLLLKLATFCNGMGLKVMVSDGDISNRDWHIYSDNNGTLEKTNCN